MGVREVDAERDLVIYAGETGKKRSERNQENREETEQVKNGVIFAGNLPGFGTAESSVLKKQELARKQARKMISDTFAGDRKVDQSMEEGREVQKELAARIQDAEGQIAKIKENKEELKKTFGIAEGSEEENLNLLRKSVKGEKLTQGEEEQLSKIDGLTEYQKEALACDGQQAVWEQEAHNAREGKKSIGVGIMESQVNRLKSSPMQKAQAQAAEIMAKASRDEIKSMMAQARDTIDENQEKAEEKQEQIKEKKEEEEKGKDKSESESADIAEGDILGKVAESKEEIDQELKKIAQDHKFLEEDLKGLMMNATV